MYTPERRPLQSAIAALLFASVVTFATVAPDAARANGANTAVSSNSVAVLPLAPRHVLA